MTAVTPAMAAMSGSVETYSDVKEHPPIQAPTLGGSCRDKRTGVSAADAAQPPAAFRRRGTVCGLARFAIDPLFRRRLPREAEEGAAEAATDDAAGVAVGAASRRD